MNSQKDQKKKKKMSTALYISGSIVLTAVAAVMLPKIIGKTASALYAKKTFDVNDDDDWGPVITKNEDK